MFNKIFYTLLTIINLFVLYITQFFTGLNPFYLQLGCFLVTCFLVLFVNQFTSATGQTLSAKIEKLIDNGKAAYFITFIAVIDIILFMFIVPQASLTLFEKKYQTSFIFYGLLIFFIPVIIIKFTLEPHGKEIENLFWSEYQTQIRTNKPSMTFALFILARVQIKATPFQTQPKESVQSYGNETQLVDQISTTTFPIDYTAKIDPKELDNQNPNSLFDSNDDLAEENALDKYLVEIYQLLPGLEKLSSLKPIRIRPELFLNIIIEKTYKDPQMVQFFRDCT